MDKNTTEKHETPINDAQGHADFVKFYYNTEIRDGSSSGRPNNKRIDPTLLRQSKSSGDLLPVKILQTVLQISLVRPHDTYSKRKDLHLRDW